MLEPCSELHVSKLPEPGKIKLSYIQIKTYRQRFQLGPKLSVDLYRPVYNSAIHCCGEM